MSMTLSEAARLLGVSRDATKKEINDAYRDLIKKCHPDANRNASPERKRELDRMFKSLVEARKVMLTPSLAAPEPQHQAQQYGGGASSNRAGAAQGAPTRIDRSAAPRTSPQMLRPGGATSRRVYSDDYQPPRTRQTTVVGAPEQARSQRQSTARVPHQDDAVFSHAHTGAPAAPATFSATFADPRNQSKPTVYNTSRTIHDGIPRVRDQREYDIDKMSDKASSARYRSASDVVRFTPSIITTVLLIASAIYLLASGLTAPYPAFSFANPAVVLVIAALVKALAYDFVLAYYARGVLAGRIGVSGATGLEMIVVAVASVAYLVVAGLAFQAVYLPFACIFGIGAIITIAGIASKKTRDRRAEEQARDSGYLG